VEQACHTEVSEQAGCADLFLPLTNRGSVSLVGQETLPLTAWHKRWHLLNKCLSFILELIDLWDIDDVVKVLLGDALIIVELGLVPSLVQSLHVQMQVEVS